MISASCPPVRQLSSSASRVPAESCNSKTGSASTPEKKAESDGPIARTITFFGCVPVIMNPPMRTLLPVSTRRRVEMLPKTLPGAGVPLGVGDGVTEGVVVGVTEGVTLALTVAVGLCDGVPTTVAVGVAVAVTVGVAVGLDVAVAVGVPLGDGLAVGPSALIMNPVSFTNVAYPGPISGSPAAAPATRTKARSAVYVPAGRVPAGTY